MKDRRDLWYRNPAFEIFYDFFDSYCFCRTGDAGVWGWVDRQGTVKGLDLVDFNYPQVILKPASSLSQNTRKFNPSMSYNQRP